MNKHIYEYIFILNKHVLLLWDQIFFVAHHYNYYYILCLLPLTINPPTKNENALVVFAGKRVTTVEGTLITAGALDLKPAKRIVSQ